MTTLALATYADEPRLIPEDALLVQALAALGIHASPLDWEAPADQLEPFDALLFRSCWNYHLKRQEFLRWLDTLERRGLPVWNPLEVVRWNMDKSYLLELGARGIPIPPTLLVEPASIPDLEQALGDLEWQELVIKPAVSMSAWKTVRVDRARLELATFFEGQEGPPRLLVQELIPQVITEGELSFHFFDGCFSHAIRKRPRAGDFRVQSDFGGTRELFAPPERLINQAAAMLRTLPGPLLYARVDAVEVGKELILMELELIDPMLFLASAPDAAGRLARAVAGRLRPAPSHVTC